MAEVQAPAAPEVAPAPAAPPAAPAVKAAFAGHPRVSVRASAQPPVETPPPAAPATPEAAPAPQSEATEPKGPTRAQLAAQNKQLARQMKELQARAAEADRLAGLEASLKDPVKRWKALEDSGIKYDEWTMAKLQESGVATPEPEPPAVAKLREELEALRTENKTRAESEQTARADADFQRAKAHAHNIVKQGGDRFALTGALGLDEHLIHEYQRQVKEGVEKPDELAVAEEVEKRNERSLRLQIAAIAGTAKGRALLSELLGVNAAAEPAPPAAAPKPKAAPAPTNGLSAERSGSPDWQKLTAAQKSRLALERSQQRRAQH